MTVNQESRLTTILAVERTALAMRYILVPVVIGLYIGGFLWLPSVDVGIVVTLIILHNLFVQVLLWSKRYRLFGSWLNFWIYYIETCLIILSTGAERSAGFVLFILLLIGLTAHLDRFRHFLAAGIFFAASLIALVYLNWLEHGALAMPVGDIATKALFIVFAGWMVGRLSALLRRTEEEVQSQAQALAASEASLRAILNSAADPIVVYGDDEIIQDANDQACHFLDVARENLVGQRFRRFLFDDGTLAAKTAALRTRGEYRGEQVVLLDEGEGDERSVDLVVRSFIRDDARYYVALMHDVTDKKELQEATRRANMKLERLNQELRQVDEFKTNFLVSIAHKLRSPLAAITGHVDTMLDEDIGEINPDQRDALHACQRSTLKLLRLTDEAIDLTESSPAESTRGDGTK
jgi:PAS domain S-box-containing protein